MLNSIDLVASDAIYHGLCEFISCTKKCISTKKGTETEHTAGHPTDNAMKSNFEKLCKWLVYSEWASCKNRFICRKRSKCSLLTIFLNQVDSCDLDWPDVLTGA